jgi:hypothetical protein
MSAEQVAKLRSELDVVQTNAQVFGEMLVTLQPGEEDPQDFELLMVKIVLFFLTFLNTMHKVKVKITIETNNSKLFVNFFFFLGIT